MDNPFAIVCQVVLLKLQQDLDDVELLKLKVQLFRKMLSKNYPKKIIRALSFFIKEYVSFGEKKFYDKFDEEIEKITNKSEPMGIEETVIAIRSRRARQEGIEEGIEKGIEIERVKSKALSDYYNILKAFIRMPKWDTAQTADFFEIKEAKVIKLKAILADPDQKKREKAIRQLFFKDIQLDEEEWKKVTDLVATYRKKM